MTQDELLAAIILALPGVPEPNRDIVQALLQVTHWAACGGLVGVNAQVVMADGRLLACTLGASTDPTSIDPRQTHGAPERLQ